MAAYWLRDLGKIKEAEHFLREGLLNNPDSYDIALATWAASTTRTSTIRPARGRSGIWPSASGSKQEAAGKKPDLLKLDQIAVNLAHLEEKEGNLARAIELLELAKKASPNPDALQSQIDELKQKLTARPFP